MDISENIYNYIIQNIEYVQYLLEYNYLIFLFCYIVTVCLLLFLPIPASSILVLTGILFKEDSYFINYLILNLSCLFTYLLFHYLSINKFTNIKMVNNYINNNEDELKSISQTSNFTFGRIFLPYTIFSYCCGYLRLDIKKYIVGNIIGVIPRTIIISSLSLGINSIKLNNGINLTEFINDPNTIIAVSALICLYIFRIIYKSRRK